MSWIQFRLNSIPRNPLRIEWQSDVISKGKVSDDLIEWLLIPLELRTYTAFGLAIITTELFLLFSFFDLPGGSDKTDEGAGVCDSL